MELKQLLIALRRRWKFVTLIFLASLIGAGVITSAIQPTYASTTRVYLAASGNGTTIDSYQLGLYAAQRVASYANLATDDAVLVSVVKRAGLDVDSEDLAEDISVTAVPGSVILEVTGTGSTPEEALAITRAEAAEIIALVARLESATGNDGEPKGKATLVAKTAGDPSFSEKPVSPNVALNLVVGGLLGLMLGVAGAVLRETLDNSVATSTELAEVTGGSVMTVIPFDPNIAKHPLISDELVPSGRGEAFRVLRTNLQFIHIDSQHQTLVLSSAVPNEGKTAVATNLAIALAQAGRRVLLIDCDLRKPSVAELLGVDNSVGMATVLLGGASLADCVQMHSTGVAVLATGPRPPNPAEVLATDAMRSLLAQAHAEYDVVLLDAPPLLPVTDPAILAAMADGVLLVARHGKTSRDQIRQAVERVRAVDAKVLGVVMNMAPKRAVETSDYGYAYGAGYGPAASPGSAKSAEVKGPKRRSNRAEGLDEGAPAQAR